MNVWINFWILKWRSQQGWPGNTSGSNFPAVTTVLGNTPNFAKVGNTWKYEIFIAVLAKILSFCYKFKLNAYFSYHLNMYYVSNNINSKTGPYQNTADEFVLTQSGSH